MCRIRAMCLDVNVRTVCEQHGGRAGSRGRYIRRPGRARAPFPGNLPLGDRAQPTATECVTFAPADGGLLTFVLTTGIECIKYMSKLTLS